MFKFVIVFKAVIYGFLTGFIMSIPLGPSGVESVKRTISKGFKEGFAVSVGAICADMTYLLLISSGFARLVKGYKKAEAFFWIISGLLLCFIGYHSIKNADNKTSSSPKFLGSIKFNSLPFLTGYLITLSNPATPSVWLFMSGTLLHVWYERGIVCYYAGIISILAGMIAWFALLNILALKGFKFLNPSKSVKTTLLLMWAILLMGVGFVFYGIIKLF